MADFSSSVSPSDSLLARLIQPDLTRHVESLSDDQFTQLLQQLTKEFQHYLRAIALINNDALETLLEQVLEAITLKVGQVLQAERTTIFLVDVEKAQLWSKVAQGDCFQANSEGDRTIEIRLPLNEGIAGYVATTGKSLNISDAYQHPLFNPSIDRQTGYRTRNILCMPIFDTQDQVVAIAQLLNKRGTQPFDPQDEAHFRNFAHSIGVILESCNSFYMAARNQRGATALLNATTLLAQSLDLEKTLQAVMDEARKLMRADRSTLFLLDRDRHELWSKVPTADRKQLLEIRIPMNRGIVGFVASTGQVVNVENAYEDPRFDPTTDRQTGYKTRTILSMPVFNSAGKLIGVTQLINKYQGSFTRSDEEFMQAFNTQAGIALENAQLFERVLLEKQYQKDILQSLSDAVISTDLQGNVVTINDAALGLLGCSTGDASGQADLWREQLLRRPVWEVIPIDNLQLRLQDSLQCGARHYVPEQSLEVGLLELPEHSPLDPTVSPALSLSPRLTHALVVSDRHTPDQYLLWNDPATPLTPAAAGLGVVPAIRPIEHSVNLTVNPLTNPDGKVLGGLVVLEDISQEKRMKATMYRYMTPGVAERVMALGDDALMVGERKDVTILFSDIRGYTSLTEKMEAADVVTLLNDYFETMVEAVFTYEGTLDKFIGDALMAVFGAPLPLPNHPWMAVQSALDMRRRLKEFNEHRRLANQPIIRIGIGISSGEVVSGNIGSQKRMDYTVIGDGVDISARLEGVTKEYGCDIILSEYTYKLCRDQVWVRELDRIRVKGKTIPINIYELIGDRTQPLPPETAAFLNHYAAGRTAYNHLRFYEALQHFERAQDIKPGDRAVQVHLERAREFLLTPPADNWDGVHTMTTK
ncbi:GAF domain-containing protein [Thermoleptolyngbya sichuanensis XZ-Cy5]|uniref:adenylate/guanylate cyclase domain-containing protein n=1 Tax=Thermoleptolyngbya sichuanensis TaxID=2885951 RepID=UPI00240E276B|nr:adenylate/guanylate cyclase domain-containing protein [Thermoleptolyngbya sichuanensis]MDG2615679.1 GAF domain-containing protein [Thermoleptolyngbya sichuanensis XZ-Cy5]